MFELYGSFKYTRSPFSFGGLLSRSWPNEFGISIQNFGAYIPMSGMFDIYQEIISEAYI